MIKEKTITKCRTSAERGQSLHRLWSILYLPELFFSSDFFCMNNQIKPDVFGGAELKICIYFELSLLLHCVLTCFEGFLILFTSQIKQGVIEESPTTPWTK